MSEPNWHDRLEPAQAIAKKEHRTLLLYFWAPG